MRIGYDKRGNFRMYPNNKNEFEIMNRIYKDMFGIDISNSYDFYSEYGILLAISHETKLIIEKMRDDKIERLLQIRHKDENIRFAARTMLKILWS